MSWGFGAKTRAAPNLVVILRRHKVTKIFKGESTMFKPGEKNPTTSQKNVKTGTPTTPKKETTPPASKPGQANVPNKPKQK